MEQMILDKWRRDQTQNYEALCWVDNAIYLAAGHLRFISTSRAEESCLEIMKKRIIYYDGVIV